MTPPPFASLTFHHMGLAVKSDETALKMLRGLGYAIGDRVYDACQNVHVRLCTSADHPTVEICDPGVGESSVLDNIVKKYNGLIYHLCYETPDLSQTLQLFRDAGLRLATISPPKPAVLFGGRHVSFYQVADWGIIELLEAA
jgi:hypothetical protein